MKILLFDVRIFSLSTCQVWCKSEHYCRFVYGIHKHTNKQTQLSYYYRYFDYTKSPIIRVPIAGKAKQQPPECIQDLAARMHALCSRETAYTQEVMT